MVCMVVAVGLGSVGVCFGEPTVEIDMPAPDPSHHMPGDTVTFEAQLHDGGDQDYTVRWVFEDGPGSVQEGLNLFQVDHEMCWAGDHWVVVEVWNHNNVLEATDAKAFWVLWVDLELVNSGSCPSENNDKREAYNERLRPVPGDYGLGLRRYAWNRQGWGVAVHGHVSPECWDEPLSLTQSGAGQTYWGVAGDVLHEPLNGGDTQEQLLDNTKPQLYQMDYPGIRYSTTVLDQIHRIRANFSNVVTWWGTRCSNEFTWCTAQSWHHVGPTGHDWATFTDAQVNPQPGDNICVGSDHLPSTTWSMY